MFNTLSPYNLILGSGSPRRREILADTGLPFEVKVAPGCDESYPPELSCEDVACYISAQKAEALRTTISNEHDIVITADTIVCLDDTIMGKPADVADARRMLQMLSGRTHRVITGVTLLSTNRKTTFCDITTVTFDELSPAAIDYYIDNYSPFDKAGAYGIQEWIGMVGVAKIEGSFYNVVGFPIHRVIQELAKF